MHISTRQDAMGDILMRYVLTEGKQPAYMMEVISSCIFCAHMCLYTYKPLLFLAQVISNF